MEVKVGDVVKLKDSGALVAVIATNVAIPKIDNDHNVLGIETGYVVRILSNDHNVVVLDENIDTEVVADGKPEEVFSVTGLRQMIESYVANAGDDVKVIGGGLLELLKDIPEIYYPQMPALAEAIRESNRIFKEESAFPVTEHVQRPWNSPAIAGIWHSVRNHIATSKNIDVSEIVRELPPVMSNNPKIRPYSND